MTTPRSHDDSYQLTVPASSSLVATIRLFVSAVGRTKGLDDDSVEDLKLAASELATAIVQGAHTSIISLSWVEATDSYWTIGPWRETVDLDDEFGPLEITESLFPGTRVEGDLVVVPVRAGS